MSVEALNVLTPRAVADGCPEGDGKEDRGRRVEKHLGRKGD
jgi:hypothetical protein